MIPSDSEIAAAFCTTHSCSPSRRLRRHQRLLYGKAVESLCQRGPHQNDGLETPVFLVRSQQTSQRGLVCSRGSRAHLPAREGCGRTGTRSTTPSAAPQSPSFPRSARERPSYNFFPWKRGRLLGWWSKEVGSPQPSDGSTSARPRPRHCTCMNYATQVPPGPWSRFIQPNTAHLQPSPSPPPPDPQQSFIRQEAQGRPLSRRSQGAGTSAAPRIATAQHGGEPNPDRHAPFFHTKGGFRHPRPSLPCQ